MSSDIELSSRFHDSFLFRITSSTNSLRVRVVVEERDDTSPSTDTNSSANQNNFYKYQFGFDGDISAVLESNDIPIVKDPNTEISDWFPMSIVSHSFGIGANATGTESQIGKISSPHNSLWSKMVR
jgi:hypothetical protein